MPNRNRRAGDYFERRSQDALEAHGWLVIRSAGSLGIADLVALKTGNRPLLISCKINGYLSRKDSLALIQAAEDAGAHALLAHREKVGWVRLDLVQRHGRFKVGQLHMPARASDARKLKPKATDETLVDPLQLTIFDALADD